MDRSWISANRLTGEYRNGVEEFIAFAQTHSDTTVLKCPCTKCGNVRYGNIEKIREHLICTGIMQHYTKWTHHGETEDHGSSKHPTFDGGIETMVEDAYQQYAGDPDRFIELLSEAEAPLYPNCSKFTKLSALISLWNLKAKNAWSDTSFNALLEVLRDMLPENNLIPESVYKAKTTLEALGMEYEKIHACPNDCVLYRKEYADARKCPTCGASRWEKAKDDRVRGVGKFVTPYSRIGTRSRCREKSQTDQKMAEMQARLDMLEARIMSTVTPTPATASQQPVTDIGSTSTTCKMNLDSPTAAIIATSSTLSLERPTLLSKDNLVERMQLVLSLKH